jgi:hypothetical protein
MSEHVWMDFEPNLGFVAGAGEQLGEARRGEWATALRGEADWRFSSRSARNSSPKSGCAHRTCIVVVSNSIDDHCSSQSPDTPLGVHRDLYPLELSPGRVS